MNRERGVGIVLIALGAIFLLGRFVDLGAALWPLFVMAPGLALLAWAFLGGPGSAGLAVPGSIVTMVGLVLLIQNATGRFDTWAYAWGLIVASVGVGTWLYGSLANKEKEMTDGARTAMVGLALFAGFGVFFEFVIGLGGRSPVLGGWLVPVLLIAAGAALLFWRRPSA
jgi:hypothetical protein